ncbi:hypothetical protein FHR24_001472 [Wenyingzhuangia heitensis]|uniref:Uncharacterized protein n=1 Tax=Wenyingzhuangia heitensis TaxID=1487859 RepID=A0ABX0U9X0_9FLAO|nr:hypothetical protein [Wenyingzhuangia heitensis]NIJ45033.1 hypothetical protein [Wenyingzhuangia heitensis]
MLATKEQKKLIRKNCEYKVAIKEEFVQWATEDNNKTSLNDLTFDQANKILSAQTGKTNTADNWAYFDYKNPKHKTILSLLRQANWTVPNERHGCVADLERFSNFLKDGKSPVKKPLKKMEDEELEKVIVALRGVVASKYKKRR